MDKTQFSSFAKTALVLGACMFGWYSYNSRPFNQGAALPQAASTPEKTPAVMKTVSFVVQGNGNSGGNKYLNSLPNYRAPGCNSIKLTGNAALIDATALMGKTVTVTGMTYKGRYGDVTTISDQSAIQIK